MQMLRWIFPVKPLWKRTYSNEHTFNKLQQKEMTSTEKNEDTHLNEERKINKKSFLFRVINK